MPHTGVIFMLSFLFVLDCGAPLLRIGPVTLSTTITILSTERRLELIIYSKLSTHLLHANIIYAIQFNTFIGAVEYIRIFYIMYIYILIITLASFLHCTPNTNQPRYTRSRTEPPRLRVQELPPKKGSQKRT